MISDIYPQLQELHALCPGLEKTKVLRLQYIPEVKNSYCYCYSWYESKLLIAASYLLSWKQVQVPVLVSILLEKKKA